MAKAPKKSAKRAAKKSSPRKMAKKQDGGPVIEATYQAYKRLKQSGFKDRDWRFFGWGKADRLLSLGPLPVANTRQQVYDIIIFSIVPQC